jgi:hypothetical protein
LKPPNFLTILCNIDAHFADLKLFRAKIWKSHLTSAMRHPARAPVSQFW